MTGSPTFFVSRAGHDAEFARSIARVLDDAGFGVVLADSFGHGNIIAEMDLGLRRAGFVIALLSPWYLKSEYCAAEWTNGLHGDPTNRRNRLIPFLIERFDLEHSMLGQLRYEDLTVVREDPRALAKLVLSAVRESIRRADSELPASATTSTIILDPESIAPLDTFTNGREELAWIEATLEHHGVAIVFGPPGTGKSCLAREYAWRYRGRYSAIVWISAASEAGVIDGLVKLATSFAIGMERVADRRDVARELIARDLSRDGKPALLVFDDITDEAMLQRWHPLSGAHVLATSRYSTWTEAGNATLIRPWTISDSIFFLMKAIARRDIDEGAVRALAMSLDGLPLALSHAASYLRETRNSTVESYLAHLDDRTGREPRAENLLPVSTTIHAAIARAEQEAPGATAILCLAAFLAPGRIPEEIFLADDGRGRELRAALTSPITPSVATTMGRLPCVESALGALERFSLISFAVQDRTFSTHRLVQTAVRELIRTNTRAWLRYAVWTIDLLFPKAASIARPAFEAWDECARLVPHARSVLASLPDDDTLHEAGSLAARCAAYLRDRGEYGEAERLIRRSISIANQEGNPATIASRLNTLGMILRRTSHYRDAETTLRHALALGKRADGLPARELAAIYTNLGAIVSDLERYKEAEQLLRNALRIDESAGSDDLEVAVDLDYLGDILVDEGRIDEAESLVRRSLPLKGGLGPDDPRMAVTLGTIGVILMAKGLYRRAENPLRHALDIFEAAYGPDDLHVAEALANVGEVLARTGRRDEALPLLRRAVGIGETHLDTDHPIVQGMQERLHQLSVRRPWENR